MLIWLFIGVILAWLYLTKREIGAQFNKWIEIIVIGTVLAIFIYSLQKGLFRNGRDKFLEHFQEDNLIDNLEKERELEDIDLIETVSKLDVELKGQRDQSQMIVELFQKYQDLLRKYTQIKNNAEISEAECRQKLDAAKQELLIEIKRYQRYRDRVRQVVSDNYIRKDTVDRYITKHPNFQKKCADPNFFDITKHQNYQQPNELNDITQHPDFINKCSDPEYFDLSKHQDYQKNCDFSKYDIYKHADFNLKCGDPRYFSIKKHQDYEPPQTLEQLDVTQHYDFARKCSDPIHFRSFH